MTNPRMLPLVGPARKRALEALSPDPLDDLPAFVAAVSQRLEKGRGAYGDTSFDKPIIELLGELEQECLDLAGWGFVLWVRLQRLKSATDNAAKQHDNSGDSKPSRPQHRERYAPNGPPSTEDEIDKWF